MHDVSAGNCTKACVQRAGGEDGREEREDGVEKCIIGGPQGSSSPELALEILRGVPCSIKGHVIFRGRGGESLK